jgi:diguanylate cyclase (GGDEF)-like protein
MHLNESSNGPTHLRQAFASNGCGASVTEAPRLFSARRCRFLDRFKNINDEHGHLAGDAVLCDFANLARSLVRRSDVIGRIGGEEFLLVMHGTTAAEALWAVERMRHAALSRIVLSVASKEVRYSVSAGITQVSRGDRLDETFYRADRALYKVKRLGRNQVLVEL